jgi:hypothetical protein
VTFLRTDDDELFPGENFYSRIPQHWIRDFRLTAMEFRVLTYWASHRNNYRVSVEQTDAEIKEGRHAIYAAIKGLIDKGYIVRRQGRDEKSGKRTAVEYTFGPAAFKQQYVRAWGRSDGADGAPPESEDPVESSQVEPASEIPGTGFSESRSTASSVAGSRRAGSRKPHTKKNNPLEDQSFLEDQENPPPPGRPEVTTRAREAAQEGEDSPKDTNPGDGEPAQSRLDAFVAEIHALTPATTPEAIRDALTAAHAQGKDPSLIVAAAMSLARGDHGPTKYGFKSRLLADGPWWATAAERVAVADAGRVAAAARCGKHPGQLADNCAGCIVDAKIPDVPAGPVMTAAEAKAAAAERIAAAVAKNKIANNTRTRTIGEAGNSDGENGQMPVLPAVDPAAGMSRRTDPVIHPGLQPVG